MKKCPKCGNTTDSKFCPECGTDLSAVDELRICPKCGFETKSKFCPECGSPIEPLVAISDEVTTESPKEVVIDTSVEDKAKTIAIPTNSISAEAKKPATEKKKISKKTIAIIVAVVVVLFALIGLLGGKDSSTSETTTSEEPTTTEETTTAEPEPEPEPEPLDYSSLFGEFTKAEDYESLNYDNIARNPDDYKDKKYVGSGKVLQVLESDSEVDMRIAVNDDYDTVAYLVYSPSIVDSRILEDDEVTFYGESKGLYSYESTMGATITIPMLYVQKIERK